MYPRSASMSRFQPNHNKAKSTLAIILVIALSGSANAQNALGDGNALDANTGQSGRVNPTRPNFTAELSFRNAIATGNAPGGLSFRGDLGYRAAGEFRGELGSDSLFAFRRDSLYSGLAGMGIRGTDALQYQFALTTGATPPKNLMGNLSIARDTYFTSNASGTTNTNIGIAIGRDQEAADLDLRGKQLSVPTGISESSSMLGSLRSSSTYATTTNLQPTLLSVFTEGVDHKPVGLIASPLLGIIAIPMVQDEQLPNPLVARPANANTNPNASDSTPPTRLETSYQGIVEQMRLHVEALREQADAAGQSSINPDETNDTWLVRQMQELREKLYGQRPANDDDPNAQDPDTDDPTETADPQDDPNDPNDPLSVINDPESPLAQRVRLPQTGINQDPTAVELYDPTNMAIDPETLEVLRGSAANEIERLLDPGADKRNIYVEHINTGERLIASGRYFDAEERFTHALSVKPRDISAQLGRLHAQIGAGMVLSASVNLQTLLSQHPEIIASRYSGNLLPNEQRIDSLIARLKERAGITRPEHSTRRMESDRVRVSASILLAYLGYQVDDEEAITQGLDMIKERGSDADRRFVSLLSQLWFGHSTNTDKEADQD